MTEREQTERDYGEGAWCSPGATPCGACPACVETGREQTDNLAGITKPYQNPARLPQETGQEQAPEHMTDDEWRTLLQLIVKHTGTHHFQQWDTFSLPLPGTSNRLYVHWGMQPPHGQQYEHLYPLVDPETGQVKDQP